LRVVRDDYGRGAFEDIVLSCVKYERDSSLVVIIRFLALINEGLR